MKFGVIKWLLIVVVAALATWAGIEFGRWSHAPQSLPPSPENGDAVQQLLVTSFKTPNNEAKKLNDWQNKILVINFWATWCPPCREEMPEFSRAQEKYGASNVQFVGIAIDEAANVVEFSKKTPVAYPLLIASPDLTALMAKLGNQQQVLPFTVIIGRDGKLISSHLGRLNGAELVTQLTPLL